MQKYEMLVKGQTNIKVTTNSPGSTLITYKLTEDINGNVVITDITEATPTISSIANGLFSQYLLTVPNEDCYVLCLLNGMPKFFRVGTPTIRGLIYANVAGLTLPYELLDFAGTVIQNNNLTDVGNGVYCMKPATTGDYILNITGMGPVPMHTPYVVDTAGMSGKIVFEKDRWMLLAIPKSNAKISDVVDAIGNKYGIDPWSIFVVFSAYPSTTTQHGEMLDYARPTPNGSKYNFNLVYSDGTNTEITGMWCKTLNYQLKDANGNNIPDLVEYEWHA